MTANAAKSGADATVEESGRKTRARPDLSAAVEGLLEILNSEAGQFELAVGETDKRPLMSVKLSRAEAAHIVRWLVGRHDIEAAMALQRLDLAEGPDATTRSAMEEIHGVERWFKTRDELFDALEAAE